MQERRTIMRNKKTSILSVILMLLFALSIVEVAAQETES